MSASSLTSKVMTSFTAPPTFRRQGPSCVHMTREPAKFGVDLQGLAVRAGFACAAQVPLGERSVDSGAEVSRNSLDASGLEGLVVVEEEPIELLSIEDRLVHRLPDP